MSRRNSGTFHRLAVAFAQKGFRVCGFDLDSEKVETLRDGASYIEDVPSSLVAEVTAAGRLTATTDFGELSSSDVINVCVPTPLTRAKEPALAHAAIAALAERGKTPSDSDLAEMDALWDAAKAAER